MVDERAYPWRPGSFSKNFSWGQSEGVGLSQLHEVIRIGFNKTIAPIKRETFRSRVRKELHVPDLIAVNFFLFNFTQNDVDWIAVDELVSNAILHEHSHAFDFLALLSLHISKVGRWSGARPFQRYPALWAKYFVIDQINIDGRWDANSINSDNIEEYFKQNMEFGSERPRKFATNLNDIYRRADVSRFTNSVTSSWWGSGVYLALDRILLDQGLDVKDLSTKKLLLALDEDQFWQLTAVPPQRGRIAAVDLIEAYRASGGPNRFEQTLSKSELQESKQNSGKNRLRKHLADEGTLRPIVRVYVRAQRQSRKRNLVAFLKAIYEQECAICGMALKIGIDPHKKYSEVGHIRPLGTPFDGPDHLSNMLVFCPNHHKAFDHGGIQFERKGDELIVRAENGEIDIEGRRFIVDPLHNLNLDYLKWHAKYFNS